MKTPEEIKKGLECCTADINECDSCPYREYNWCEEKLKVDALELLGDLFKDREERDDLAEECQNLEQRLAQAENTLEMQRAEREDTIKKHIDFVERLAQAERERDAAVFDLEECADGFCSHCKNINLAARCDYSGECRVCLNDECPCHKRNCRWQWRGVCEENSK